MDDIIRMEHVTKLYPGVAALKDVSFSVQRGEIHALVGENGAGKSTLIKVIAGVIRPTEGSVFIDGQQFDARSPHGLRETDVSVVYQELNLVPTLSVAENIFLGQKIGQGRYLMRKKQMILQADALLKEYGISLDPSELVENLSVGRQQLVEIVKALARTTKIIIMDEPSASLSAGEVQYLFSIIRMLKQRGITIIYISHRMEEIFSIADRVTILRDGQYIDTLPIEGVTRAKLIPLMVGRELSETYPEHAPHSDEVVLETRMLSGNGDHDISIQLHKGEILGMAGLIGAGRSEFAEMLVGMVRPSSGEIYVRSEKTVISSPSQALKKGIGLIPEDRKKLGLFLDFSILWNGEMSVLKSVSKGAVIDHKKAREIVEKYTDQMHVKAVSLDVAAGTLSGGNQQKVVLSKTLACDCDILIFDEPTRGIDVAAKREIYELMCRLTEQGASIIMISSDMEEILGISDRIVVMYEGRVTGELTREQFSQNRVLEYASGMSA